MGDSENICLRPNSDPQPSPAVPTGWVATSDQQRPQPPFAQYNFSQATPHFSKRMMPPIASFRILWGEAKP
jgi:hypothetical protein